MKNYTKIYIGIGAVALVSYLVYNHIKNKYKPTDINKIDLSKTTNQDTISCSVKKLLGLKCDLPILT